MYITKVRFALKVRESVVRYAPAEICGTVTALIAAYAVLNTTDSLALAAVSGTIGENIGYYGAISARELMAYWRMHHGHGRFRRGWLTAAHALRGMMVEFGLAEALDSLVVRPSLFYTVPLFLGQERYALGLLIAKLAADVVFYGVAIAGWEMRKRYIDKAPIIEVRKS